MKGILKKLSIAAAMLVLCTGLAACGQTGQEAQSGTGGMTGTEGQTVSGNPGSPAIRASKLPPAIRATKLPPAIRAPKAQSL